MENADFAIYGGYATIWLFEPISQVAQEFVLENLEIADWQWSGEGFAVDRRQAFRLCEALIEEGFTVMYSEFGQWRSR